MRAGPRIRCGTAPALAPILLASGLLATPTPVAAQVDVDRPVVVASKPFAESLILAETGFVNKSIQIAGTAEATQLPFFIAACDYTLIGEELFAVSAYLSKDPRLVSSLKASDWVKLFVVISLLVGTVLATFGVPLVINLFTIAGG